MCVSCLLVCEILPTNTIYPFFSLEASVELDNGNIVYSTMNVNNKGLKEEYFEDNHWTYTEPLTEVSMENPEYYYYEDLSLEETQELGEMLVDIWNNNPIFVGDGKWIDLD